MRLSFIYEGDRALQMEVCHHSISLYIAGYLNKAIWNLRNLCNRNFAQHGFVANYCVCFCRKF